MTLVAVALRRGQRLGRRPGPPVVLPLVEPADQGLHVGVAEVAHGLGREGRAHAPGAVDDDRARLVGELALHLELEVAARQVDRVGDGALLVLVGLADVEEGDPTLSRRAWAAGGSTSRMEALASFSRSRGLDTLDLRVVA